MSFDGIISNIESVIRTVGGLAVFGLMVKMDIELLARKSIFLLVVCTVLCLLILFLIAAPDTITQLRDMFGNKVLHGN